MSNHHITPAIRCSQFKGIARQLLFILADAASPGPKDKKDKVLPFGFCKRKLTAVSTMEQQLALRDGAR